MIVTCLRLYFPTSYRPVLVFPKTDPLMGTRFLLSTEYDMSSPTSPLGYPVVFPVRSLDECCITGIKPRECDNPNPL